jgi:hypothetical protein
MGTRTYLLLGVLAVVPALIATPLSAQSRPSILGGGPLMQNLLGASDAEWKVLEPKIEKVQTLLLQSSVHGGWMNHPGSDPAHVPDVVKTLESLRKLLQNKEAKAEDVATALKDYRQARAKAQEALEKAQKDLKEVVTIRQEALLVTMGVLP